jgi:hypothetical protein
MYRKECALHALSARVKKLFEYNVWLVMLENMPVNRRLKVWELAVQPTPHIGHLANVVRLVVQDDDGLLSNRAFQSVY